MKFARSALNSARYFWAKLDAPARAEGLLLRSRWALPCFVSDESREDSTGRRKPACLKRRKPDGHVVALSASGG